MKLFINKGCHIRKVNGKIILFVYKRNVYPVQISKEILFLLLCIGEGKAPDEIREDMKVKHTVEYNKTDFLLELIGSFLTRDEKEAMSSERYPEFCKEIIRVLQNNNTKGLYYYESKNLDFLSVEVTKLCSRKCIYCYAGAGEGESAVGSGENIMEYKVFEKLIDNAKETGIKTVELTGGDPLVIKDIERYIKKVLDCGFECFVSTKHYVTPERAKKIKECGLNVIQVSLDSSDKNIADRMIGCQGGFNEVIQSINNLQEAGVDVIVKAVITSLNIRRIPDLIQYCTKLGVKKITFNLYGMSCGRHNTAFYADEEAIMQLTKEIKSLRERFKSRIFIEYPELYIEQFIKTNNGSLEYKHYYRGVCSPLSTSIFVMSNGDIPYCSYLASEKDMILGNIKEESFSDILGSKKLAKWKSPDKELYADTECYKCGEFEDCYKRRCHFRTFIAKGTVYAKDPWCKYGDINFKEY